MSLLNGLIWRLSFVSVITASAATVACRGSAVSKEEVERLVDQRLAERGLAPAASASVSSSPPASAPSPKSGGGAGDDPAAASTAFLARLDDLMKDFKPELPVVEDKTDLLRCLTTDAKSSPDVRKAISSMKGRTAAGRQDAKKKADDFYRTAYPLGFHYDLDWATRRGMVPAEYGCSDIYDGEWTKSLNTKEDCEGYGKYTKRVEWKLRQPARPGPFVYSNTESAPTTPPELMRRMAAVGLQPPARFSCRVEDVLATKDGREIKCRFGLSPVTIRASGALPSLNVGDLVSVPLAGAKRDPEGVLYKLIATKTWVVDADAATLTVDTAAACPTIPEVLASLADGGAK